MLELRDKLKLHSIVRLDYKLFVLSGCILLICFIFYLNYEGTMPALTFKTQCNCDELLINTYLNCIKSSTENFYAEYYTITPVVDSYSVTVKEFSSDNSLSTITFITKPYLGPHDTIGIDEITYSADYTGKIKLEKFDHLISYNLPSNLKNLEKRRFPGKYES